MKTLVKKANWKLFTALYCNREGLSTVEYIIILSLIAVAGIVLWQEFGGLVTEKNSDANTEMGTL